MTMQAISHHNNYASNNYDVISSKNSSLYTATFTLM